MSEPFENLLPDQRRRRTAMQMASQYDRPTYYDQAPVERAGLLPLGTYPNGQTGLAFPGFITEPVESWNRMLTAASNGERPSPEDSFNVAGAAMVGGFAAPKPTNTLGTFGGRLAAENLAKAGELRPLRAMDMAAKLKAEGADPVRIYDRTSASLEGTPYAGVHYGADGVPKFEISDHNLSYTPGVEKKGLFGFGKGYTEETQRGLSGSLSHPDLLAAYPDLGARRLDIKAGQDVAENGGWARGRIVAEGPADKIPQIAAHELQHELQRREGFATGTNLAWAKGDPDYSPPNSLDRALGYDPAYSDIYKPTMGEVEARNVEARLNMTPEERRMTPPWKTQDTPYGDQIDNVTPWQRFANRMLRPFYESNLGMSLESNDWIRQAGTKRRDANTERLRDHERAIQQAEAEWGSDNPLFGHNSGASATLPTRFSQGLYANGGRQGAATGAAVNSMAETPSTRVYRGSVSNQNRYQGPESSGFWGSTDPEAANRFANVNAGPANVTPADVRFQNPLVVDVHGGTWAGVPYNGSRMTTDDVSASARAAGHDGVIFKNMNESGVTSDVYNAIGRGTVTSPFTGDLLYANGGPYGHALNLLSQYYGQPVPQQHWSNSMRDGDL